MVLSELLLSRRTVPVPLDHWEAVLGTEAWHGVSVRQHVHSARQRAIPATRGTRTFERPFLRFLPAPGPTTIDPPCAAMPHGAGAAAAAAAAGAGCMKLFVCATGVRSREPELPLLASSRDARRFG